MARTPKPPGQRVHRNPGPTWRKLPASPGGEVPKLPRRWPETRRAAARQWWERAWSSPMSVAFIDADLSALERGAALAGHLDHEPGDTRALAELRAIEDRFGLSPLARRRLQWEIDQATERVAPPPRSRRRDTRLQVVP